MITDTDRTRKSWRHDSLSFVLGGTLAAGDYVGNTSEGSEAGVAMPGCDLTEIHYSAEASAGSGDTEVAIHNVTSGESATFSPTESTGSAGVDLHFGVGDELAISVAGVDGTTAGSGVALLASYRKYRVSSTQHGD